MKQDHHRLFDTKIRTKLTNAVSTTTTISTGYHWPAVLCSFIWCRMIKTIFIQNARAGAAIMNTDRNNDDTSGPKTNLPPKKNFCLIQQYKNHFSYQNQEKEAVFDLCNYVHQVWSSRTGKNLPNKKQNITAYIAATPDFIQPQRLGFFAVHASPIQL